VSLIGRNRRWGGEGDGNMTEVVHRREIPDARGSRRGEKASPRKKKAGGRGVTEDERELDSRGDRAVPRRENKANYWRILIMNRPRQSREGKISRSENGPGGTL